MDYFSGDHEREKQEAFAQKRVEFFKPLLAFLTKMKIAPNHITWVGVGSLLLAAFIPLTHLWLIAICLCLYVLSDGIDGPLARYQGNNHQGGSIVDIYADQLGVVVLPMMAIHYLDINGVLVTAFTSGYLVLIILALYQNSLGVLNRNFIRVKYPLYILYFLSLVMQYTQVLSIFFALFAAYYWLESHFAVLRLYRHFEQNGQDS